MEGKRFRVGSVAVLFAVAVLCSAIFCILTAVTAVSDRRTARHYGDHVAQVSHCQELGQLWLSQADAYYAGLGQIPDGTAEENGNLYTQIDDGPVRLTIRTERRGETYRILRWDCITRWEPGDDWTLLQ